MNYQKLNSAEVVKLLKQREESNIHHYLGHIAIYQDGDEIGRLSDKVFNNLLNTDKIRFYCGSKDTWSKGWYCLK